MKTIKAFALGLAAIFLITNLTYAQPPEKQQERQERQKEKKAQLFKELGLSPQQQQNLEENRKAQHEEMGKARKAMDENYAKLRAAMNDPGVTRASVQPIVNEMKALQSKMIDGRVDGIFTVKEILTPEQFAKFQQLMEKKMDQKRKGDKE